MNILMECDGKTNPVCTAMNPVFSWYVEDLDDGSSFQTSYHIKVFDKKGNVFWDSEKQESSESTCVEYRGKKLNSHTRYYWNVTVESEKGCYKSDTAFFVTGIADGDWKAEWITGKNIKSPVFYKKFNISEIKDSYAFVCGLGYFELYINNKRVGDDYFVPNQTDYEEISYENLKYPFNGNTRKRINYLGYDVTQYLNVGENCVAIMLGNGFYKQTERVTEGIFKYDELKAIFQMICGDELIVSDLSWNVCNGPVLSNNIFYGEVYDAGCDKFEIKKACIAKTPDADFTPQYAPADRVMEILTPQEICTGIYDAGKNMTGFARICCRGKRGSKITIKYFEELDGDNNPDYTSTVGYEECDKNQIQQDTYILSGDGDETYQPHFVWHGFRYFKIETEDAKITDVKAYYIYTGVEQTNKFECSDSMLNAIHNICVNSQKSAIHGAVPVDCPHRERLGYTGDGQNASYSTMFNFNCKNMYKKWIYDIFDTQNIETGFVTHTAPFMGGGGGPAWGSAIAIVPWNYYLHYGDKNVLKDALPKVEKWIKYLKSCTNEKGLVSREEHGSWCLGDWCLPIGIEWSEPCIDKLKIPSELVNTCFYIYCMKIYQKMQKALGITECSYTEEIEKTKVAVNNEYLSNYYAFGVQGCDVYPLFTNIVPDNAKEGVLANLKNNLKQNGYKFDTGIFGTSYLLNVLAENGLNHYAYRLLKQTDYPSYGYMLKNGATSVWETWEGSGSHNHEGLCGFDYWFYHNLAGIKPGDAGGFKEFDISPYFADDIEYVNASYKTVYGYIHIRWERKDGKINLTLTVPFNTSAHLYIEDKKYNLTCGTYIYEFETKNVSLKNKGEDIHENECIIKKAGCF